MAGGKRRSNDRMALAEVIERLLDQLRATSGKTQREVATEIGYENPNIITMFKQGRTRVPLNVVGPLAEALEVSPAYLMKVALSEYAPDTYAAIQDALGRPVADWEGKILDVVAEETGGQPVNLTPEALERLRTWARSLVDAPPSQGRRRSRARRDTP
jgi:transcriptional regulator with XRE-family HTH domain